MISDFVHVFIPLNTFTFINNFLSVIGKKLQMEILKIKTCF